eukprot:GGOE01011870.1.p3 GENE.GGOE01011870.1~~GGOE01011870.1.p3  ORF type:complete len:130 (-),score=0.92 GGOE01011870.1:690-1079(-)
MLFLSITQQPPGECTANVLPGSSRPVPHPSPVGTGFSRVSPLPLVSKRGVCTCTLTLRFAQVSSTSPCHVEPLPIPPFAAFPTPTAPELAHPSSVTCDLCHQNFTLLLRRVVVLQLDRVRSRELTHIQH